ncbi:DUF5666 domain-containing protein [Pseudofrankia sp. DC12]|uniref:DUF5666 domain-containing protein n=1 Tax=Pseudofrankia sp. DC12 TaxID=683315 RepID=UPI0005F79459|nr:DUF5666 domain-containing protein [Pseudofrankia sp. DC12]
MRPRSLSQLRRPRPAILPWPAIGALVVLTVAACGTASSGSSPAAPQPSSTASAAASQGAGIRPAASGTIAAVSATNAQVQNPANGQVTVDWTAATRFSRTETVTASALAVGDCVTAVGGTASGGTGTGFTATTVTLSMPVNGRCAGGLGGTAGGFRGTRPGGATGGATSRPNRTSPAGTGRFQTAFGTVTSVSGSTFEVKGVARARAANSTASPALATTTTVTIGSSTTLQRTEAATPSALVVGECLTAIGKADDTGAVTATAISVAPAGRQGCATGFGMGRFGGAQAGGQTANGATNG